MNYSVDYKFKYASSKREESEGVWIEAGSEQEAIEKTMNWLGTDINGNDGWLQLEKDENGLKVYRENVLYIEFYDFVVTPGVESEGCKDDF